MSKLGQKWCFESQPAQGVLKCILASKLFGFRGCASELSKKEYHHRYWGMSGAFRETVLRLASFCLFFFYICQFNVELFVAGYFFSLKISFRLHVLFELTKVRMSQKPVLEGIESVERVCQVDGLFVWVLLLGTLRWLYVFLQERSEPVRASLCVAVQIIGRDRARQCRVLTSHLVEFPT